MCSTNILLCVMDNSFSCWWQIFLYMMQIFWIELWKLSLSTHHTLLYDPLLMQWNQVTSLQQIFKKIVYKSTNKRGIHSLREQTWNKNRAQNEVKGLEQSGEKVIRTSRYYCDRDSGENVTEWYRMHCRVMCFREEAVWSGEGHLPESLQLVRQPSQRDQETG